MPPSEELKDPFDAAAYVKWYGGGRKQNWTTPRTLFEPLNAEYGFTLDGASEPGNGLLDRASTAERPLPWDCERVFCNPPWSNIPPFIELAATADLAVLLVPARTNSRWFHRALELGAQVRFFLGRPKFGSGPHNSPVDCLYLVFEARAASAAADRAAALRELAEIQRTSQPSSLIDAARELLVDIDAFNKGGAFKKLRSYQRVRELTDYVPVGMGQIDRTGTLGSPCAKCDPERWKDCDLFGCDRVRAE